MRETIVVKTSVFPADARTVWARLGELRTLQEIARPYAAFEPLDDCAVWYEGGTFRLRLKLFCLFPLGVHTVQVLRWDERTHTVLTHEGNPFVPLWNHEITIVPQGRTCRYTDRVTMGAGWRTPLVGLWARCFYRHRQKRWIELLQEVPGR